MVKKNEGEILRCSFCNKDQKDVRKLIAGPTVFICDECVEVCNDIMADDERVARERGGETASVPPEPPAVQDSDMARLTGEVAGLGRYDQWFLLTYLLSRYEYACYKARRCGTNALSSAAAPARVDNATILTIVDRLWQLSSSDQWLVIEHLLARWPAI